MTVSIKAESREMNIRYSTISLPLIENALDRYTNIDMSNYYLVATQHLMGTSLALFDALNSLGIPYNRMYVTGKSYSVNKYVFKSLKNRGVWINDSCFLYTHNRENQLKNYNIFLRNNIKNTIEKLLDDNINNKKEKKILVLDDGGLTILQLLKMVKNKNFMLSKYSIYAVEQTNNGIQKFQQEKLFFPIVNIAGSNAKLQLESPFIGLSVVEQMVYRLFSIFGDSLNLSTFNILIIGYGNIGKAIANICLKISMKNILIYDKNTEKMSLAKKDGFRIVNQLDDALLQSNLVFGCTGENIIKYQNILNAQNKTIFVSASTSNIEFLNLYKYANKVDNIGYKKELKNQTNQQLHLDNIIYYDDKEFIVLNGGFPVNFDGSIDPIEKQFIQLTRALMLIGAIDVISKHNKKGLFSFNSKLESKLFIDFEKEIKNWQQKDSIFANFLRLYNEK